MAITLEQLVAEIQRARSELHDTLVRTHHLYSGIDFAWIGHSDDEGKLQLLTGTLSLSLDEGVERIFGNSGRFIFERNRLADTNADILAQLGLIAASQYVHADPVQHRTLHFAPSNLYSNFNSWRNADEVSVHTTWTQGERPVMDWQRLTNDLQAGKASRHGSFQSISDLCEEFEIEDPQKHRGLQAKIPRRGSLAAIRNPDGTLDLHVTLPRKADLTEARLQVYRGNRKGEPLPLRGKTKVEAGNDCVVKVPWAVGPSGKDTVQLFFADRPIAKCEVSDITPHGLAYLAFDRDAATLRKHVLQPELPSTPPATWTKDQKDIAARFEPACGTLLALLGFRVTPMGGLGVQGDWLAEFRVNGTTVQFLVETSVALKDPPDLKKLATNARHLGKKQQFHVPAAVFTAVPHGTDLPFDGNAEGQGVRVVYQPDLEWLLTLALDTTSENRTRDAFQRITGMMI